MAIQIPDFNAAGPLVDAEIYTFQPGMVGPLDARWQPLLDQLFYSSTASVAVFIYLAQGVGAAAQNTIPLVNATLQFAIRNCIRVPRIVPVQGSLPWSLRITKADPAAAVVRGFWTNDN